MTQLFLSISLSVVQTYNIVTCDLLKYSSMVGFDLVICIDAEPASVMNNTGSEAEIMSG